MAGFLLGVDEAGRGPLAGPVAVGVVRVPRGLDVRCRFPGVDDSKKLSAPARERIYRLLEASRIAGEVDFCVRFASAKTIDTIGITAAVRRAAWRGVRALAPEPEGQRVLLDGLLAAPPEYAQATIVGGDASEPVISLASIAAKVARDRLMVRLARQYPEWGFDVHKGYGTAAHRAAIGRLGLCAEHRRSFCRGQ